MSEVLTRKRDIYIVLSGGRPLHAVCTERQARRFIESYGKPTEDCRLFLGDLSYTKICLIPPRKMKKSQMKVIKEVLS